MFFLLFLMKKKCNKTVFFSFLGGILKTRTQNTKARVLVRSQLNGNLSCVVPGGQRLSGSIDATSVLIVLSEKGCWKYVCVKKNKASSTAHPP